MLAPMGIGALYGKMEWLEKMPPFLTGGEMIEYVTRTGATYAEVPHKFEAGTVNAAGAYALGEAIRYIEGIGFEEITKREDELTALAMEEMKKNPYVHIIGSDRPEDHHGILAFTVQDVHPHDDRSQCNGDDIEGDCQGADVQVPERGISHQQKYRSKQSHQRESHCLTLFVHMKFSSLLPFSLWEIQYKLPR